MCIVTLQGVFAVRLYTCPGKTRLGRYGQAAKGQATGQDGGHKLTVRPVCSIAVDSQCTRHITEPFQQIPLQETSTSVVCTWLEGRRDVLPLGMHGHLANMQWKHNTILPLQAWPR